MEDSEYFEDVEDEDESVGKLQITSKESLSKEHYNLQDHKKTDDSNPITMNINVN